MANLKISQLPAAGALATTDVLPLVQGTSTNKLAVSSLDSRYLRKGQPEAPGSELHYAENTTPVVSSATAAASAVVVFPGASVTYDGGPILVQAYSPYVLNNTAQALSYVDLWDGTNDLGVVGSIYGYLVNQPNSWYVARRLTPSAGAHTFSLRLWTNVGQVNFYGGVGGPGVYLPSFFRITKV